MDNITTREEWVKAVKGHEVDTKALETEVRSVMQSFNSEGRMFASAEYIKVQGQPVRINYRVFK